MYFSETQKFRQWWIWPGIAAPFVAVITLLAVLPPADKTNISPALWTVLLVAPLPAALLLLLLRLETTIDHEKVSVRFFPLHAKARHFYWTDIQTASVRTYRPLKEYGGWGIRKSFRNGTAYSVRGSEGLQLGLKNGRKILVGTQQPEALRQVLVSLKKQR